MGGGKAVEEIIEVVEEVERASHQQTLKNVFLVVVLDGTFTISLVST